MVIVDAGGFDVWDVRVGCGVGSRCVFVALSIIVVGM